MNCDSDQALRVVLNVTETDELKRLREENRKLKDMHAAIVELTEQHEKKYFDLVWYARRYPVDALDPYIRGLMDKVEAEHTTETKDLASEKGDWTHGFNSGLLAASRLYSSFTALEDFKYDDYECYCFCGEDPFPECQCECKDFKPDEDHMRMVEKEGGNRVFTDISSVRMQRKRGLEEFPFLCT